MRIQVSGVCMLASVITRTSSALYITVRSCILKHTDGSEPRVRACVAEPFTRDGCWRPCKVLLAMPVAVYFSDDKLLLIAI